MLSFILPLISLASATDAVINYGLNDYITGCQPSSQSGVYYEFGADLEERLIKTFSYEKNARTIQSNSITMSLPTGGVDFQYASISQPRQPGFVYGVVTVHTMFNGVYKLLDQVLIHPNTWETFSSVILEANVDQDNQLRIKYLTVDCYCRARVVSLVNLEAMTTACDDVTQAEAPVLRSCTPESGFIAFFPKTNQEFQKIHSRRPMLLGKPYTLEFGKCNADIVDFALPFFCLAVKSKGVVLDYVRVHPVEDTTLSNGAFFKGYDYTNVIDMQDVGLPSASGVVVSVKYLMRDCTCRERRYLINGSQATLLSDIACYTFPTTQLLAWSPPSAQ